MRNPGFNEEERFQLHAFWFFRRIMLGMFTIRETKDFSIQKDVADRVGWFDLLYIFFVMYIL